MYKITTCSFDNMIAKRYFDFNIIDISRVYPEELLYAVGNNKNFPYFYFLLIILIESHTESLSILIPDLKEYNYGSRYIWSTQKGHSECISMILLTIKLFEVLDKFSSSFFQQHKDFCIFTTFHCCPLESFPISSKIFYWMISWIL